MQENDNSINKDIRFEALFNSASLGIIVVDKKGMIVLANHFANKLFAYQEQSMEGKYWKSLFPKGTITIMLDTEKATPTILKPEVWELA